jgi:peptidyl-prolyl cis-trans isomerase SurA
VKYSFSTWAPILLALASSHAQVTSHAPTVFKPATAQKASATSPQPIPTKPVVRVNGAVLTDADLLREEYAIFPYARQHNGIPKDLAPQIRDGALKMIIFEELVYQEAKHRNILVPPAKLQRAEADFRKQFHTPEEFNTFMQSEFQGSRPLLEEKIRRSLLIDTLLKTEVENKCTVSAPEAKAFYDQNPARFTHPEMFTFQSISILPPPNATAAQSKDGRTRAENALRQARTTKSAEEFGLLAEKVSDDDYRVMMGQHKPVPADELPPQVVKTLAALQPNQISDIIQVDQALTIVRLQEHKPAGKARFDEVKEKIQKDLQEARRNQLRAAFDKKLRATARIEQM